MNPKDQEETNEFTEESNIEETDYILHYTIDYWANEVNNENTLMCV